MPGVGVTDEISQHDMLHIVMTAARRRCE